MLLGVLSTTVALFCVAGAALAQDPVKVAPKNYKLLLENDRVRALEYRGKSGEKTPMHSHPTSVAYVLSGGKIKFTFPDGKTEDREPKAGTANWQEAVTHSAENVGDREIRVVRVELKRTATGAGTPLAQDPVKLAPNIYKVLFENDRVRMLDFRLKPGEKSSMHSHPAYFVYSLSDYRIRHTFPDGRSEEREAKAGAALWREAVTHAGENAGTTEAHAVLIELK
jgi:quercetin dioxygenase-like cupin family protein